MSKDCVALVSTAPFAVPPSSFALIVIVAVPFASAAAVNVNVPVADTVGAAENKAAFVLFVISKLTAWAASLVGPALIAVAQPAIVCAPASSSRVWSAPLTKLGSSLTAVTVIV